MAQGEGKAERCRGVSLPTGPKAGEKMYMPYLCDVGYDKTTGAQRPEAALATGGVMGDAVLALQDTFPAGQLAMCKEAGGMHSTWGGEFVYPPPELQVARAGDAPANDTHIDVRTCSARRPHRDTHLWRDI